MDRPSGYEPETLTPDEVAGLAGPVVLEFGSESCGICAQVEPHVRRALDGAGAPVRHLKIADGPGRPLGRSFRVKLWPTLILLRDGAEVGRLVRPRSTPEIAEALAVLVEGVPGARDRASTAKP